MIAVEATLNITPALVKFTRLAGRFTNFTPVIGGRVDVLARQLIRRQFETLGRASGQGQWPALSPQYAERKAQDEFGRDRTGQTMRRTDSLFHVLTDRGAFGQKLVTSPMLYRLGIEEEAVDPTGRRLFPRFIAAQLGIAPQPRRQLIPDPLPQTFLAAVRKAVKSYIVYGDA